MSSHSHSWAKTFGPRHLAQTALLIAIGWLIGHARPIEHASRVLWDATELAFGRELEGKDHVSLVTISAKEYAEMFDASSPLDPDRLAALIAKTLGAEPKRLYVDIDTSAARFRDLDIRIAYYLACNSSKGCPAGKFSTFAEDRCRPAAKPSGPMVLADLLREQIETVNKVVRWARAVELNEDGQYVGPALVLGGADVAERAGLVAVRPSTDGRVRDFPILPLPALWQLAARDLAELEPRLAEKMSNVKLTERPVFLAAFRDPRFTETSASNLMTGETAKLKGKVVFLGGRYDRADAFYLGDGQPHPGVTLLAAASLAHANAEFVREGPVFELMAKIALGLMILIVNQFSPPC